MTEHDGAARSEAPLSYTLRSFLACSMVGLTSFSASAMVDLSWILCTAHSIPQYMGIEELQGEDRVACQFYLFWEDLAAFDTFHCCGSHLQNDVCVKIPPSWIPRHWVDPLLDGGFQLSVLIQRIPVAPILVLMLRLLSWCSNWCPDAVINFLRLKVLSWYCHLCPGAQHVGRMLWSISWCCHLCPDA